MSKMFKNLRTRFAQWLLQKAYSMNDMCEHGDKYGCWKCVR